MEPNDIPTTEDELRRHFGTDYAEPSRKSNMNDSDWDDWASSIEIRLGKTSTIALGALAGAVVGLVLVGLQGTVVVRLMKTQGQIVGAVNGMAEVMQNNGGTIASNPKRYSEPSGATKDAPTPPVDEAEFNELQELMRKSNNGELPNFNEG